MKLNDLFSGVSDDGIFSYLSRLPTKPPWDESSQFLDLQYHKNHSGGKIISPLVDTLLIGGVLTSEDKMILASTVYGIYGKNWVRLWNAITADYNPISNYDMTETFEETGNNSENGSKTSSLTHGEKITTNGDTTQSTFGFNSGNAVPADTATGSQTEVHSGDDGTSETDSKTGNHDVSHTLKRSGNIGVTTSQQMLESEYELRKRNFFEQVFKDIDKVLVIDTY